MAATEEDIKNLGLRSGSDDSILFFTGPGSDSIVKCYYVAYDHNNIAIRSLNFDIELYPLANIRGLQRRN
ncbi:hypothetical protein [Pseudomonas brassicacearum]|uniref:hypothetical protein n=1 Tax=Pseudomonas brassicacearum TaxID=930166 RepID=UPI001BDF67CF|nr:hypothetical protein [Pseudomonas brassicacearum]